VLSSFYEVLLQWSQVVLGPHSTCVDCREVKHECVSGDWPLFIMCSVEMLLGGWLGWVQGTSVRLGLDPLRGSGNFGELSSPLKSIESLLWCSLQEVNNSITAPLLQRTAMLPTGECHIMLFPVKNPPPLWRSRSSEFLTTCSHCSRKECNSGTGVPPIYVNVNMWSGEPVNNWMDSLQAAWPGVQVSTVMINTDRVSRDIE